MKKLAITGHTDGIGGALVELIKDEYEILGMSRTNGFYLTKEGIVERIFETAKDCDIFVNNAFCRSRQTELYDIFYDNWKTDPTKHIINIGSKLRLNVDETGFIGQNNPYSNEKRDLHLRWMANLHDSDRRCKISNISPGFVDTKFSSYSKLPEGMKLDKFEVANYIKWILGQPDNIELGEVSFWRIKR